MDFKVGQVWADRLHREWTIVCVDATDTYPVQAERDGKEYFFTENGRWSKDALTALDLVRLIKDTEEPVRNAETNLLPPEPSGLPAEPTAGQFYSTRDGRKMLFIGKGQHGYYYEGENANATFCYNTPFSYISDGLSGVRDIVALWTEPLPAIEIKRYVLVAAVGKTRGDILEMHDSKEEAEFECSKYAFPDDIEIVETIIILPSREV